MVPLSSFLHQPGSRSPPDQSLRQQVVHRHVSAAQALAKSEHDHGHSHDPTGADQEDIPEWAHTFYRLFEDTQIANSKAIQAER